MLMHFNRIMALSLSPLLNKLMVVYLCVITLVDAVPQETCVYDVQCHDFCQKYGYNQGYCRLRWSSQQLSVAKKTCHCHECDPLKCMTHCYKRKLQFAGCVCYNLLIPGGPLFGIYNKHHLNDCSDEKLVCQCGR